MIPQIRPADLHLWLQTEQTKHPIVLDVREPGELITASVLAKDFELIAIPMGEIATRIQELPADRPIACLCHHGRRSQQVANYLIEQGFTKVVNVAGGINAWSKEIDTSIPLY